MGLLPLRLSREMDRKRRGISTIRKGAEAEPSPSSAMLPVRLQAQSPNSAWKQQPAASFAETSTSKTAGQPMTSDSSASELQQKATPSSSSGLQNQPSPQSPPPTVVKEATPSSISGLQSQ